MLREILYKLESSGNKVRGQSVFCYLLPFHFARQARISGRETIVGGFSASRNKGCRVTRSRGNESIMSERIMAAGAVLVRRIESLHGQSN